MAKTEAEILQTFKDYAKSKNLSVSEITMQKRAAKIAQKALEDAELEQSLIDADLEFLEVINDNIRHERAQQKKDDEANFKKVEPIAPKEPKEVDDNPVLAKLEALEKKLSAYEQKETVLQKRQSIESKLYTKGIDKKDKAIVEKILSTQSITVETDEDAVVDTLVDVYNSLKSSFSGGNPPLSASGSPTEDKKLLDIFQKAKEINDLNN